MEFYYKVSMWIEADSIEEAEEIYANGEWDIDGHEVFAYDEDGNEYEVEIP